ncbi:hypothetical protein ABIA40_000324 [Bradyrhizobium sp. USDA 223]
MRPLFALGAEPLAVAADRQHVAVVQKPIEDGGSDHGIGEHGAPLAALRFDVTVYPARIASRPSAMDRCVLPRPGGPSSSTFSPLAIQRAAAKVTDLLWIDPSAAAPRSLEVEARKAAAIPAPRTVPLRPATPARWAESTIRSRRPSDCLWTATWCSPWRIHTSPAAIVTATRSPIGRHRSRRRNHYRRCRSVRARIRTTAARRAASTNVSRHAQSG